MSTIVWLRRDLRLSDNPALVAAAADGAPVIPVFVYGEREAKLAEEGAASRWWLHHSLEKLSTAFAAIGSRLIIRAGDPLTELPALLRETGASRIRVNRRYEPDGIRTDDEARQAVKNLGATWHEHLGNVLFEPEDVTTQAGTPFRVFTPWWRAAQQHQPTEPLPAPSRLPVPSSWPASASVDSLQFLPAIDWAGGFRESWTPGEAGAQLRLEHALDAVVQRYQETRDTPADVSGTSRLSPHLHFGEISPREAWHRILEAIPNNSAAFRRQLGWRDFAVSVLAANPHTVHRGLDSRFDNFPWLNKPAALKAWQRGQTGYPLVDAGMRELWHTGWMHNRVRMNVASFLVKHLMIHWRHGADWFADTLVDSDLANNVFGWQWASGCGADAAPYFRIFNPFLQSERFDGKGDYIRRWVPELANVRGKWIHKPWEAPPLELASQGVYLGDTYPHPIVDHKRARERALAAYASLKKG